MTDFNLNSRPKRREGVRARRVGKRVALIIGSEGVELNETAEAVWRLCSGEESVQGIVDSIAEEYDAEPDQIAQDVVELVQEMEALEALELLPQA